MLLKEKDPSDQAVQELEAIARKPGLPKDTLATFKADEGLLVSWGGFNRAVQQEARLSFFSVRLWDADDLIAAIVRNYDRLPKKLHSELPLKRIWTLVVEEE